MVTIKGATAADVAELQRRGATVGPAANVGELPRARGRLRHESGRLNKLEAAWAAELDVRRAAGVVAAYWFEAVKLRLADKTFLTPDFMVLLSDGLIEMHDCKGFVEDDSAVKIKVAASLYKLFVFKMVMRKRGAWLEKVIAIP